MKKNKIIIIICAVIIIATIISFSKDIILDKTSIIANANGLSNKKIGWGIKRADNNQQPDLGEKNQKVLEEYNGISIGNKDIKNVYLTFDEGYEAGYTEKILDTLKENNVKSTFFITAHYLNTNEQLVKRMLQEGHIVGNHTVNHKSMPDLTDEKIKTEIQQLHTAIYEKTGYEMKYIRPPMGEFSQRTLSITNNLGYTTVMWSFAYDDFNEQKQKGEEHAKEKILKNVHNGSIMLLHGNSKDNTNVLDYCIKEIKNMGYEFKTLEEFVK